MSPGVLFVTTVRPSNFLRKMAGPLSYVLVVLSRQLVLVIVMETLLLP